MQKWEYKVEVTQGGAQRDQAMLNTLGQDGWEMIGCHNGIFYLKRPNPLTMAVQTSRSKGPM